MTTTSRHTDEESIPNPEYLIRSIAEQGYSLETSLADLTDNSISAGADKVEILTDMEKEPFTLFLADNGHGMDEESLRINMQFPSDSPAHLREPNDLGRFGLGMKAASFAQTRSFTVLSRKKGEKEFSGRTWDVDYLKTHGWRIIVNSKSETEALLKHYQRVSKQFIGAFKDFIPNTIIIWKGLYKFERYLQGENRQNAFKKEINETTSEYLSLVFHRFMEKKSKALNIRINNKQLKPYNPFPDAKDVRTLEYKQRDFGNDYIKMEGYILPSRSIEESRSDHSEWTPHHKGLMEMEGIYVYRADRIILYGGWNGLIRKAPRLQLARLKVDVGNGVDDLLQLNVAKSRIVIPYELKKAFTGYIQSLKTEAEREYFNKGIRKFSGVKKEEKNYLFNRIATGKGMELRLNDEFPVLRELTASLDKQQRSNLKVLLRMIEARLNQIRQTYEEREFIEVEQEGVISQEELNSCVDQLLENGLDGRIILEEILPNLGYKKESFPETLIKRLKNNEA